MCRAMKLRSYACDAWYEAQSNFVPVGSAVDGGTVALVSSAGLDTAAMLRFAREVGGKNLRATTFRTRAEILRDLARYLGERKAALYEASYRTGATARDRALDIDAGIDALSAYAALGRRELPDADFILDGPAQELAGGEPVTRRHILTPRRGVALFINAYSFPCRALLAKFAPAFLAGVPAIVKPATPTVYVAALLLDYVFESGILPVGSLQSILGAPGDLLDHLIGQDSVSFTGSRESAIAVQTHPAMSRRGVRFVSERESPCAAVLAPDASAGTPEFDLFIAEVVREMTRNAGQNCLAIRRAIVPRGAMDAVLAALSAALDRVVVGDPRDPETTMGPLVSAGQCDAVRARVLELLRSDATVVYGHPTAVPEGKAYMSPIVLACKDPLTATVAHEVEAFGPVATLMPYDTLAEAIELVNRAEGSLLASIFTYDREIASELFAGIAPYHGRVVAIDRDCANQSPGHGGPVPAPDGLRSLDLYLQRTAVQGSPDRIAAYANAWSPGAAERESELHPFRYAYDKLTIGQTLHTAARTISLEDIETFAHFTGDTFYAHMDDAAAKANPFFPGRVAHGYLLLSFAAGLFVDAAPGPVLANTGLDALRFVKPVEPGDAIAVRLTVKEKTPRKPAYGEVRWDVALTNQHGETVATYELLTMNATARALTAKPGSGKLLEPTIR
jgi:oxepin-CoA hydrolase/3-oxo-5,6-dehydrosuberyl-CoA semialdehyde dehydrogenase